MAQFKVGDLVKIIRNPDTSQPNWHIAQIGLQGFIEEITDDYAYFIELKGGTGGGQGSVHVSNLELANDDIKLQYFKKLRDEYLNKLLVQAQLYTDKYNNSYNKFIDDLCKNYNNSISKQDIKFIVESAFNFREEWNRENHGR